MNMGAYFHVAPRLKTCMLEEGRTPDHQMPYTGRPPCASTATGFGKVGLRCWAPAWLSASCSRPLLRLPAPRAASTEQLMVSLGQSCPVSAEGYTRRL